MKIRITEQHISEGISHCEKCPIALALIDNGFDNVCVISDEFTGVDKTGQPWSYALPWVCRVFIDLFDKGENVEPFDFDIIEHPVSGLI